MADRDAFVEFQSCMEAVIGRAADERSRIILQIVAASLDAGRLAQLQSDLDRFPADSRKRNIIDFARVAEQIAAVAPQIIALDLDRTTPVRILGVGKIAGPVLFAAKCFGHSVTAVARANFISDLFLKLYGVPCFNPKAQGDLPEGPFDFIITYGGPHLSTKQAWAAFVAPLAGSLAASGRVFVVLVKEPNPRRNYYPELVLAKLAQIGARVSSRHGFALLDRAVIGRLCGASAEEKEGIATPPDGIPANAAAAAEAPPVEHRDLSRAAPSGWTIGAALVGCFTILLGLWSRFGRPLN